MRFMLISDAVCLSLQSSEECGVLRFVAEHCCSHVKHACSRNVKVQSCFFTITTHKESCQTPQMLKMLPTDHFRSGSGLLSLSVSDLISLWALVEGCPLDKLKEAGAGPHMCV